MSRLKLLGLRALNANWSTNLLQVIKMKFDQIAKGLGCVPSPFGLLTDVNQALDSRTHSSAVILSRNVLETYFSLA